MKQCQDERKLWIKAQSNSYEVSHFPLWVLYENAPKEIFEHETEMNMVFEGMHAAFKANSKCEHTTVKWEEMQQRSWNRFEPEI